MSIQIKLKNSVVQDSTPSASDLPEVGELAVNANINSIGGFMRASDNSIVKIFGPGSVTTPTATTTVSGIAELATSAETTTGSATNRVVTPAGLNAVTVAERSTSNSTYLALAGGTLTGVVAATAGSNSAPSIHFGDSDSGIFGGTNTVSLTAGGTTRLTADTGVSVVGTLAVTGAITSTSDLTIPDKIIHFGDTNTAVRFPAADTVSVETGGSEAVRVDSSQRLLVGTSSARAIAGSASRLLEIEGTDGASGISLTRNSADNAQPKISFGKTRSASNGGVIVVQDNDKLGEINFAGADGTDVISQAASITAEVDGTPGANDMPGRLVFSTTADGAASPTTRLTIDSAGLSTFTGQIISNGTFTIENTGPAIVLKDTDHNSDFQIKNENGQFRVRDTTNSQNRFTIASDGVADITGNLNVGAGLDVTGAITASTSITASGSLTTNGNFTISSTNPNIFLTDTDNDSDFRISNSNGLLEIRDITNTTTRFCIKSDGKVGIGTTAQDTNLQVNIGNANASDFTTSEALGGTNNLNLIAAQLKNTGSGNAEVGLLLSTGDTAFAQWSINAIKTGDHVGDLAFRTKTGGASAAERLRITSDGRLGLGLTPNTSDVATNVSPGLFQTDGNIDIRYSGTNSDPAGARYLNFINTDTTLVAGQPMGGLHWIGNDSDNPNSITAAILADCSGNAGTSSHLLFKTAGSERMRIDATTGRVGIGTTSPNTILDVRDSSGTGISSRSTATQATDTNKGLKVRNNSDTDTFSVSYKGEGYFAGRLGIGESDPDVSLHIKESSPRIHLEDTGTNAVFRINADSSVGNAALDVDINSDTSTPSLIVNIKGTERMRLTSEGRLGIGTSSPSQLMEIASTAPNIRLTDTVHGYAEIDGNSSDLKFNADKGNAKADTTITFFVDNSEKVRIDDNGYFFVGCTAQPVSGDNGAFITGNSYHVFARNTNSATSATFRVFGGAGEFRITGTGDAKNTNNSYAAISDQELKENIVDANSQWNDIKALKVRNYNFKESTGYSTHKQIGVIAQELEASGMNGLVATDDDELYTENDTLPEGKNIGDVKEKGGTKSVAYSVLYMKGIKALQEAMAKIEILETKVAALEAG